MKWCIAALSLLCVAVGPAEAESNLIVRSDGDCPGGKAVSEALWAIRPDREWPALTATVHVVDDRVQVSLGEDRHHWREVPAPDDCADRANRVALVIAAWSGELPSYATGAPDLSIAIPAPVPVTTKKSSTVTEVGLRGFYSIVGGWAPGTSVEVGRFRREGWWGYRGIVGYQSAKTLPVDIGISHYDRILLGATIALQWNRPRWFLSGDVGLLGSLTRAYGDGYSRNDSSSGPNLAFCTEARGGVKLASYRLWADLGLQRWARKETIQVDPLAVGSSTLHSLPTWDAHAGLGVGVVFD